MSNVSIEEVSPMSCRVKWQPSDDDGGSPLLGYFVETSEDHENWTRVNKDVSTDEELILNNLVENREYSARVIAHNIVGSSTPSMAPTTFVPKIPATIPDPPTNLDLQPNGENSVILSWSPPERDGGSVILNYVFEMKIVEGDEWLLANDIGVVTDTKLTLENLDMAMEYVFRVSAVNAVGSSEASSPLEKKISESGIIVLSFFTNFHSIFNTII